MRCNIEITQFGEEGSPSQLAYIAGIPITDEVPSGLSPVYSHSGTKTDNFIFYAQSGEQWTNIEKFINAGIFSEITSYSPRFGG